MARVRFGGHRARVDHRPRGPGARAPQLRRRCSPGRGSRRQRRPCRARGRRAGQRPRHGDGARGMPARRRQADRLRDNDLGLLGLRERGRRRGHPAAGAEPPLHEHEARGRALLQGLPGAVRDRLHDPALRHPVRTPRARGRRHPGVRQQGAEGRAVDAGRRRWAVASVRVRRGSGRRGGARAGRRGQEPRLQPGQRRERDDQADRGARPGALGRRRDRVRASAPGRLQRQGRHERAGRARAGMDGAHAVCRRRQALRRVAPRPGRARRRERGRVGDPGRRARRRVAPPPDPDHLGRHRRGPRPSRARGGA